MTAYPPSPAGSPDRHLRLPGTRNLRDVGGYPAARGRRTRWRTLLRTDRLDRLPLESQRRLLDAGVRHVVDLRWPHELVSAPSVFARSSDVRYRHVPLLDDDPTPALGLAGTYLHMLDERGRQLAEVVASLLEPDGVPAIVGCAAGKDRTGVTIALVLASVGVPDDVIVADYALSAECFARPVDGADRADPLDGAIAVDCEPAWMQAVLDHLRGRHGGPLEYLVANGLGRSDVGRLAELLTEPSPAG